MTGAARATRSERTGRARLRRLGGKLALIAFGIVLGLLAVDGGLALLLARASHLSRTSRVFKAVQALYIYERRIVQFDPEMSRYDPALLYTLKPGRFTFANREFSTTFDVNRLGVRDDERSLDAPEIVVSGDSFAMGWGVEQEQTFAAVLEAETGKKVLNASVSSYATARELKLLDRVDLSRARVLIIAYCPNDKLENEQFRAAGNRVEPHPEIVWRAAGERARRDRWWWPGRYAWRLAEYALGTPERPSDDVRGEASAFLNALEHASTKDLSRLRVVVLDTDPRGTFLRAVDEAKQGAEHPPWVRALITVDAARGFGPADEIGLDTHWTPAAHRKVAERLLPLVRQALKEEAPWP